jgi:class 3 adenylate cyclase/ActR/RegA family two-component response regulator
MAKTKLVAVLFYDVVGSTELMSRVGPVASDELRGLQFAEMRGILAVHRGTEVKNLGDGMMAVFDSGSDAVACAITMQQAAAAQARRNPAAAQQIRVGISAGEATVEAGDYFGVPVVEASRLCSAADAGQILVSDLLATILAPRGTHQLEPDGMRTLKGLPEPATVWQVPWEASDDAVLRVALVDDSVILREGVARALEDEGLNVVLQASTAEELFAGLAAARPHVVITDVRMPPTHTTEGIDAAERIKSETPDVGVLVLSAVLQDAAARRLLDASTGGIGYLLKDSVGDIAELAAAVRTVASGGSVITPDVAARLATA